MKNLVELIATKRDGGELAGDEIRRVIEAFMSGEMADYQLTALLMAIVLRGMNEAETVALTRAMLDSGKTIDLSGVAGVKVDKHSTGGVGDKVSVCLLPIVAACGVPVPMVSGRGLGHTGGTLDKLEAIPGFNVNLDAARFAQIVREVGGCMIGQTAEIAPADKRIYALRDVTATVESVPLITASILSKKLAEGIDALVLDVKVGKGAFMKDLESARKLAKSIVRVGALAGKRVVALLTRMDAPLGRAVGNALETREAIELLHQKAPEDLVECTYALAVEMLLAGRRARTAPAALELITNAVRSGRAMDVMERIIAAQGGDVSVVRHPDRLPSAPVQFDVLSEQSGWVGEIDAMKIGMIVRELGAGRTRADQSVDPLAGMVILAPVGTKIASGQALARIHARSREQAEGAARPTAEAFTVAPQPPIATPLIIERIES